MQKTIQSSKVVVKLNAPIQDIDLRGFQIFLDCLLEVSTPVELCQNLFSSFLRSPAPSETDRGLHKRASLQVRLLELQSKAKSTEKDDNDGMTSCD